MWYAMLSPAEGLSLVCDFSVLVLFGIRVRADHEIIASPVEVRATLVRDGFLGFMSIARAFEPALREDARAAAILLYSSAYFSVVNMEIVSPLTRELFLRSAQSGDQRS